MTRYNESSKEDAAFKSSDVTFARCSKEGSSMPEAKALAALFNGWVWS